MASKYIKIYNDTVLKQTILQGYESQRTNENLGKISMGELAYTRDTSRLFIGNWTDQDNEKDSKYVIGGSLAGNRYLGLIDSKPLGHVSATGDNGCFPLDYENDTTDEANTVTEIGLFKKGSRFRQTGKFLKNGNLVGTIKGDGWDKEATYIDKYGVYSGDFTFDIFNNALILFDKNITTNKNEQPIRKWVGDDETGKEVFYDVSGNDITQIAKKRTKLKNLTYTSTNDTSNKYPIYGDGYVVMRILEPDGVTIDYVDKQFSKGEPTEENTSGNGNWSHNILKVNYPTDKIKESFNNDQFKLDNDGKIIFDTDGLTIGGASTTLPSTVNFGSWKLTFNKGKMNATGNYYLSVNSQGIVTSSALPEYSYTINLGEGLVNEKDGSTIILNKNSTSATIKLKGQDGVQGEASLTENPWFLNDAGSLSYSGIGGFSGNLLVITEDYEDSYKKFDSPSYPQEEENENGDEVTTQVNFKNPNNIFSKVVTPYYETDTNQGLVFLKNPYPIQWYTPPTTTTPTTVNNHKGKWAVQPYITNIEKTVSDSVVDSTSTNENGEYEFSKEEEATPNSIYYKRIPTHAQSVILEIHHSAAATIYTCKNYADATSTTGWSFPTTPNTYNKKEKIVGYSSGGGVETVEIPLYRDLLYWKDTGEDDNTEGEEYTPKDLYVKSFCFNIVSTGKVLINIIGYRV